MDTTTESGQLEASAKLMRWAGMGIGDPPINLWGDEMESFYYAWRLLEHFRSMGKGWRIQLGAGCKEWIVANSDDGLFLDGWDWDMGYIWETDPSVNRAIGLAALKAIQEDA